MTWRLAVLIAALMLISACHGFTVYWTKYASSQCTGNPFGTPEQLTNGQCKLSQGNIATMLTCSGPYSDASWTYLEFFNQGQSFSTCDIEPWKNFTGTGNDCLSIGGGLYATATCGTDPAPTDSNTSQSEEGSNTMSSSSDSGSGSQGSSSSTTSSSTSQGSGSATTSDTDAPASTNSDSQDESNSTYSLIPSAISLLVLALFKNYAPRFG